MYHKDIYLNIILVQMTHFRREQCSSCHVTPIPSQCKVCPANLLTVFWCKLHFFIAFNNKIHLVINKIGLTKTADSLNPASGLAGRTLLSPELRVTSRPCFFPSSLSLSFSVCVSPSDAFPPSVRSSVPSFIALWRGVPYDRRPSVRPPPPLPLLRASFALPPPH